MKKNASLMTRRDVLYGRTPAPEELEQLSKADGRIYMGSAGASTRPAWLEGAIQSAWRTIEALHERVMRGKQWRA